MALPTVFVSSTFYDLRYVREGLARFIEVLGFTPVLSEAGTVFYDPAMTAAEACLAEVGNADLFVLVIGGRYGTILPDGTSVTNSEYQTAVKENIPVFAMVEQGTLNDFGLYRANKSIAATLNYPNADDPRIFAFIEDVQGRAANNALVPFASFSDIENYLRLQWAGMFQSMLRQRADATQVSNSLDLMSQVNERIEVMTTQILRLVGTPLDRLTVSFLQKMLLSDAIYRLRYIGTNPTPGDILKNATLTDCAVALGKKFKVLAEGDPDYHRISSSSDGKIMPDVFGLAEESYEELREFMRNELARSGFDVDAFLDYERDLN